MGSTNLADREKYNIPLSQAILESRFYHNESRPVSNHKHKHPGAMVRWVKLQLSLTYYVPTISRSALLSTIYCIEAGVCSIVWSVTSSCLLSARFISSAELYNLFVSTQVASVVYIQTNFLSTTNLNLGLKIDILSPTRCWLFMVKKIMKCKYDCHIIFSQIGFLYALKLRSQTKEKQQCHCQPIYSLYGILCNKRDKGKKNCAPLLSIRWQCVGC